MQNNKIQAKNPLLAIIGYYEPKGSSLLATENPRWVGGCAISKRNDRRRNISATIGIIIAGGCSLLIQNYIILCTFV